MLNRISTVHIYWHLILFLSQYIKSIKRDDTTVQGICLFGIAPPWITFGMHLRLQEVLIERRCENPAFGVLDSTLSWANRPITGSQYRLVQVYACLYSTICAFIASLSCQLKQAFPHRRRLAWIAVCRGGRVQEARCCQILLPNKFKPLSHSRVCWLGRL